MLPQGGGGSYFVRLHRGSVGGVGVVESNDSEVKKSSLGQKNGEYVFDTRGGDTELRGIKRIV